MMKAFRRIAASAVLTGALVILGAVPAPAHLCPVSSPWELRAGEDTYYVTCAAQFHRWQGYDPVPNLFAGFSVWQETNGRAGLQTGYGGEEADTLIVSKHQDVQPFCPSVWYIDIFVNYVLEEVCWSIPEL